MHKPYNASLYKQNRQIFVAHRQRQLPPLQDIIKSDSEAANDSKLKFDEDWDCQAAFIDCGPITTTSIVPSSQTLGHSMPALSQTFDDLNFCAPNDNMLSGSNGWGSTSQYSHGTASPYASSTSSSQSFYRGPTLATQRTQQNLPSLTEMNLAESTPVYSSRNQQLSRQHTSDPYYGPSSTGALDITYGKNMQGTMTPGFGLCSTQRTPYPVTSYDTWSPSSEVCIYPNGHSWPPSIQCTSSPYVSSDPASIISSRRKRGNLPKHVTDILRQWFYEHLDHPYPTEEDKHMLIQRTQLTISQISNWFINARRRQWPALKQEREKQMHKGLVRHPTSNVTHC